MDKVSAVRTLNSDFVSRDSAVDRTVPADPVVMGYQIGRLTYSPRSTQSNLGSRKCCSEEKVTGVMLITPSRVLLTDLRNVDRLDLSKSKHAKN